MKRRNEEIQEALGLLEAPGRILMPTNREISIIDGDNKILLSWQSTDPTWIDIMERFIDTLRGLGYIIPANERLIDIWEQVKG